MTRLERHAGAGWRVAMRHYLAAGWRSPTLMSWLQLVVRLLSTTLVLGLVLAWFSAEATNVWLMLLTITSLQFVTESGFSQTFARMYGYALSGLGKSELRDLRALPARQQDTPDKETLAAVVGTAQVVHLVLALIWCVLLLLAGSLAMVGPINSLPEPHTGWIAWLIAVVASTMWVYSSQYVSVLQGGEKVHVQQRILAAINAAQMSLGALALVLGGGLIALSLAYHASFILLMWMYRLKARGLLDEWLQTPPRAGFDAQVMRSVWPSAWRSGLGVLAGQGILPVSGMIYAQLAPAIQSASYLLVLRLINVVQNFSAAPFLSHVPRMVRLRADGSLKAQMRLAQSKMRQSYAVCIAIGLAIGVLTQPLLDLIGSSTDFVPASFWAMFLAGLVLHRYIGMHMQLYATTNQILWHRINGVMGAAFLGFSWAFYPLLGAYAFPVSFVISQVVFPVWLAAWYSYKSLGISAWDFERKVLPVPLSIVLIYLGGTLMAGFP